MGQTGATEGCLNYIQYFLDVVKERHNYGYIEKKMDNQREYIQQNKQGVCGSEGS